MAKKDSVEKAVRDIRLKTRRRLYRARPRAAAGSPEGCR
jgi:hypothetical protein